MSASKQQKILRLRISSGERTINVRAMLRTDSLVKRKANGRLIPAVVLNETLYIDGGEFSQLVDGQPDMGTGSPVYKPYSRQSNIL